MLRCDSSARGPLGCWPVIFAVLFAGGYVVPPVLAPSAFAADVAEVIEAHIATGEFAPAFALAEQAEQPRQRDQWLGQIAAAQGAAGDATAAISTLGYVDDDLVRAERLAGLGPPRIGARGGGQAADFESLMELITSTVAPITWDDVGGNGSIQPFPSGIHVDPDGLIRRVLEPDRAGRLAELRVFAAARRLDDDASSPDAIRRESPMRMISLPRLERAVQLLVAAGEVIPEKMLLLAGLRRIEYVFVYPETGDLVLAGPAGDWKRDEAGRIVGAQTGRPVVQLDDLVVVWRRMCEGPDATFGCSITPRQEGLAAAKAYIQERETKPLKRGTSRAWLNEIRERIGHQDVTVSGVDPRTRVGRVLVEADYHMKLIGLGLDEGTIGVPSYLELVKVPKGQAPPPMKVLRWWFTINYDSVTVDANRAAFQLIGQGVKVSSENEFLTATGKRVHTGASEPVNLEFADNFTRHFPALAEKYPLYADLQNIFDLALVGALVNHEGLADQADWHMTCFGDPYAYQPALGHAPTKVDTVANLRKIGRNRILAAVSGGVTVDPSSMVKSDSIQIDRQGTLKSDWARGERSDDLARDAWWWD